MTTLESKFRKRINNFNKSLSQNEKGCFGLFEPLGTLYGEKQPDTDKMISLHSTFKEAKIEAGSFAVRNGYWPVIYQT